jgi:S1-C subfamily serine protease
LIATNYHVIENAHTAHVVLGDKRILSVAGLAALDQDADIAIIKVVGQVSTQPLELVADDLPPVGARV